MLMSAEMANLVLGGTGGRSEGLTMTMLKNRVRKKETTTDTASDRAIRVIFEIVRQSSGDEFSGKTRLFKAFYLAHLYYANATSRHLSDWKIVRMPNGPGIDRFEFLLSRLEQEGAITTDQIHEGPYLSTKFILGIELEDIAPLDQDAINAVKTAAKYVADKNAAHLSALTHDLSRAWLSTQDGDELNIFDDIADEETYLTQKERAEELLETFNEVWT